MTSQLPPIASLFEEITEAGWRARVDGVLKGADFTRRLAHRTLDGIAVQPLHAARADAAAVRSARDGRPWATAARVDHPEPAAAAALALADLEGGADMLALAFEDSRSARGYGLVADDVAALDAALDGVRLDLIRLRLDPAQAGVAHALLVAALVEDRKHDPAAVDIDFGIGPVGALLSAGHAPWDWPAMGTRLGETVKGLMARGFRGPFLSVDLRPCHEAGASEGQELAAALAEGVLYLRALEAAGLPMALALQAVSFTVPLDADQFMGIAKLRALRRLWASMAQTCGETPEPALVHAETSWRMLTRRDPHVNILRGTVAAFAAGAGGADTLTVLPFTQALGLADAAARRLARNTSIVLQEEAQLWRVADPAAGSGGVEALTDALCATAWDLFREIEREGGLLASAAAGRLQERIATAAAHRAQDIATRRAPLTGASDFANLTEVRPDVLPLPPRGSRASGVDSTPADAAGTTVQPLVARRLAEPFEALRDRADAALAATGRRPMIMLATIGPAADHAARLAFMRNLFEVAGMDVQVAAASDAGENASAPLVCLIGSDAGYGTEGVAAVAGLKGRVRALWLAGKPADAEAELTDAGVSRYVAAGGDMLEVLDAGLSVCGA